MVERETVPQATRSAGDLLRSSSGCGYLPDAAFGDSDEHVAFGVEPCPERELRRETGDRRLRAVGFNLDDLVGEGHRYEEVALVIHGDALGQLGRGHGEHPRESAARLRARRRRY